MPVIVQPIESRNLSSAWLAELKEVDDRLAANARSHFADMDSALAVADCYLMDYDSGEGVHPSEAGHRVIAGRQDPAGIGKCYLRASVRRLLTQH